MQSTPVEASPEADFGTTTIIFHEQSARALKLLRFRHLKNQLRDLRAEHDELQEELFGRGAP